MSNQLIKEAKECAKTLRKANMAGSAGLVDNLLTLIDQQTRELGYVKRNLEAWTDRALTAESSLNLATKALEHYADKKNHEWSDKGELAQSTLDQIRRIET
jgi:hypothetical protein